MQWHYPPENSEPKDAMEDALFSQESVVSVCLSPIAGEWLRGTAVCGRTPLPVVYVTAKHPAVRQRVSEGFVVPA